MTDKGDPVTVKSADKWADLMNEHGSLIKDEYGDAISDIDLWRMWAKKRHEEFNHTEYVRKDPKLREHAAECWLDHEGNSFHAGEFSCAKRRASPSRPLAGRRGRSSNGTT